MEHFLPKAIGYGEAFVADIAAQVRGISGHDAQEYCSIDRVIRTYHGTVFMDGGIPLESTHEASVRVRAENDFDIHLNPIAGQERTRFSKAHEFAHFVLHYFLPLKANLPNSEYVKENVAAGRMMVAHRSFEQAEYEFEANWFAAHILMPSDAFRQTFEQNQGDVILTARQFGVSGSAAEVRKSVLGL